MGIGGKIGFIFQFSGSNYGNPNLEIRPSSAVLEGFGFPRQGLTIPAVIQFTYTAVRKFIGQPN